MKESFKKVFGVTNEMNRYYRKSARMIVNYGIRKRTIETTIVPR